MCARSTEKGTATIASINKTHPSANIDLLHMDLMDLTSVVAAAAPPTIYNCAQCLAEVTLSMSQQSLLCQRCAHELGASKIFFKKRTVATVYDSK